ncbi:hypothetical protein HY385_03105 [Candidatus Daviesbacteria bacterium]|nr:hypothetical protein [Candidatus Daviesbacteria bacterium]
MPNKQSLMSNSQILWEAYDQFLLPLGGKKVPTPYRRNEVGSFQKLGPEFQGKSSPEVLTQTTKKLAKEQNFDLNKASMEEIREFMKQNKLGIDCSGFVYRMLNSLVQKVKGKSLEGFGFPHVGRTNVDRLTSDEFSIKIPDFDQIKPGDLVRLDSKALDGVPHCVIVLDHQDKIITYAHSTRQTNPNGVHMGQIIEGKFTADLKVFLYNLGDGDGIRRLKILV